MNPIAKPIFASKTAALAGVTALIGLIPAAKEFVAANPSLVLVSLSVLQVGIRFLTKGSVSLFGGD